jgi:hypothetical protein
MVDILNNKPLTQVAIPIAIGMVDAMGILKPLTQVAIPIAIGMVDAMGILKPLTQVAKLVDAPA